MSEVIPAEAVEAAAKARGCVWTPPKAKHPDCEECKEQARIILEAAAPHMQVVELAAEYRRGYRDGLADRKQVTAEPRAWEPGDPIE